MQGLEDKAATISATPDLAEVFGESDAFAEIAGHKHRPCFLGRFAMRTCAWARQRSSLSNCSNPGSGVKIGPM